MKMKDFCGEDGFINIYAAPVAKLWGINSEKTMFFTPSLSDIHCFN